MLSLKYLHAMQVFSENSRMQTKGLQMISNQFKKNYEAALSAMDAGFSSKSAQQQAIGRLSRAYDAVRDSVLYDAESGVLSLAQRGSIEQGIADGMLDMPFELHQVRLTQPWVNALKEVLPEHHSALVLLVEARKSAKEMPIKPVVKVVDAAEELAKQLEEKLNNGAAKDRDFDPSKALEDEVSLPVGAFPHMVQNSHGTVFMRWKYYLSGHVTALKTIVSIAQLLNDERSGKNAKTDAARAAIEKNDPVALRLADRWVGDRVGQAIGAVRKARTINAVTTAIKGVV